jgi:hypothetical protein
MDYDFDPDAKPTLVLAEQTQGDKFPRTLRKMLRDDSMGIDLVIYERFRIYKGTIGNSAVPVIKQIGAIEFVCQLQGIPFADQPPANKSFFEKKLRSLGMHQSSHPHACDAISHGLFYYMTEVQSRTGRVPSWVMLGVQQG